MAKLFTSVAVAFILTTFATRDTETESLELDTELEGHSHGRSHGQSHGHSHGHGHHNQHHHQAAHHKAVEKTDIEAECELDSKETDTKNVMTQIQKCLKARQELMTKTHTSLAEQKKQGKLYNEKLQKIFGVLHKLKGKGLRESWEADHNDILKQFMGEADTIQQVADKLSPDGKETPPASDKADKDNSTSATKNDNDHDVPDNSTSASSDEANNSKEQEQPATNATAGSGLLEEDQKSGLVSQLLNAFSWR